MENFSQIKDMNKTRRVFSESFKREKVRILEMGKMSISGMSRMYDVSETSLYKWKKKYSSYPAADRVVMETESDYLQLLQLSKQVEDMQRLIGVQQVKLDYFSRVLTQANAHFGEDIEKKFG